MSNDESINQQIEASLRQRETEELLAIWHLNDRTAWTDDAFRFIEIILRERLGEIPAEMESAVVEEAEPDLYHDPDTLDRLARWAINLSWVVVIGWSFYLFGEILKYVSFQKGISSSESFFGYFSAILGIFINTISGLITALFLRIAGEGIYLLMDIENNTRHEAKVK